VAAGLCRACISRVVIRYIYEHDIFSLHTCPLSKTPDGLSSVDGFGQYLAKYMKPLKHVTVS